MNNQIQELKKEAWEIAQRQLIKEAEAEGNDKKIAKLKNLKFEEADMEK